MARAHVREPIYMKDPSTGNLKLGVGASVQVCQPGTTTPFTGNVWNASSGGSNVGSTLPALGSDGVAQFWLDTQQDVDLVVTLTGYSSLQYTVSALDTADTSPTVADGSITGAKIADGAVTSTKLGAGAVTTSAIAPNAVTSAKVDGSIVTAAEVGAANGVAGLDNTGKVPSAQLPTLGTTLAGDTDVTIATPATAHMLVYSDGGKWINVLHKRRLRGYAAFKGDGTSDDSAVWNQAVTDASTKGWVEAPPGVTSCVKNITLASNVIIDLNDSIAKLHSSATSADDVFRSTNFNTLTGGGGTGGVYLSRLQHGRIDGNGRIGRHGIACYGIPRIHDVIIHGCGSSALWAEWSGTNSELSALSLADGDQTGHFSKITAYDCNLNTQLPDSNNATLQGPTTATWAANAITFNFTTPHLRRVNDTVVVIGYTPSGYNGTYTVTSVPSTTSFTVAQAVNPGTNTVVGTVTHRIFPMVAIIGMDSPFLRDLDIYQTLSVVPGSTGLVLADSGSAMQNVHVYQNFATGIDISNGNNTRSEGFYCGGHDQGILIRQNYVQMVNFFVSGGFSNGVGFDYQSVGGACQFLGGRVDTLPSGSICVRFWNTSHQTILLDAVGDGGTNTSTTYSAPNGTGGIHGALYNLGNGLNASPASLVNFA